MHDSSRSVVPSYRIAARSWLAGQGLYNGDGIGGFTYLPQAALLYVPFAMPSPLMGEVLWRLVSIGIFAIGVYHFAQATGRQQGKNIFPLMTLVAISFAWDCARNGQSTLIMTGFMLLASGDMARGKRTRATLWLAFSVAAKPLAVVLVLLIAAVDFRMTWRVLAGMAALALTPFLTQHPAYVVQQYAGWIHNSAAAAHVGVVIQGWTTPFTGLREMTGLDIPENIQTMIRLAAAVATLALCFLSKQRHGPVRSSVYVLSLAVLYLLLFSPRTENNTYAMLGPVVGYFLADALKSRSRFNEAVLLSALVFVQVISRSVSRFLAPAAKPIWLSPLLAACFAVYLLGLFVKDQVYDPEREVSESMPG